MNFQKTYYHTDSITVHNQPTHAQSYYGFPYKLYHKGKCSDCGRNREQTDGPGDCSYSHWRGHTQHTFDYENEVAYTPREPMSDGAFITCISIVVIGIIIFTLMIYKK